MAVIGFPSLTCARVAAAPLCLTGEQGRGNPTAGLWDWYRCSPGTPVCKVSVRGCGQGAGGSRSVSWGTGTSVPLFLPESVAPWLVVALAGVHRIVRLHEPARRPTSGSRIAGCSVRLFAAHPPPATCCRTLLCACLDVETTSCLVSVPLSYFLPSVWPSSLV